MRYFQIVIFAICVFFIACEKHETLPDLANNQNIVPPPPPPYGGNIMVILDSTRISQNVTASNFILQVYVSVNQNVLQLLGLSYSKIRVYDNGATFGNLPKPAKTFSKLVNSGEIYKYQFSMIDSVGAESIKSPTYAINIP